MDEVVRMVPIIEAKSLVQAYERHQVLKDINLKMERGDFLALIGPSGAGKTTIIRLLDLIEAPSSAQIFFDGNDVTRSGKSRLKARRRMARAFSRVSTPPKLCHSPSEIAGSSNPLRPVRR